MKIITLNTWGGRAGKEGLLSFFKRHRDSIDIFCLQEIWSAPYVDYDKIAVGGVVMDQSKVMTQGLQEISEVLSDHTGYFRPHFGDNYGLFMPVRKGIEVVAEGELFVYKDKNYIPESDIGNHARNIQYLTLRDKGKLVTIINFHGLWNGLGKGDSEDRITQSKNILNFVKTLKGECIMCGDFNLTLKTESIRLLEEGGFKNLISEHSVTSTRTSHYTKSDKFADYIFTSPGVAVKDFKVLPDDVSDHKALYVEAVL